MGEPESITEDLRCDILDGRFPPGERLGDRDALHEGDQRDRERRGQQGDQLIDPHRRQRTCA